MFASLKNVKTYDAKFFDLDNDGYQDIVIAGASQTEGERGVFLFHNDAPGVFVDASILLPEKVLTARHIDLFDYNSDGDLDILLSGANGGVYLVITSYSIHYTKLYEYLLR